MLGPVSLSFHSSLRAGLLPYYFKLQMYGLVDEISIGGTPPQAGGPQGG